MIPTRVDSVVPFLISALSLWLCPILAWATIRFSKDRLRLRRKVLIVALSLTLLTILALAVGVSTTIQAINWILLANIYFTICLLSWLSIYSKKWFTILPGAIFGFGAILIGYILGSVGIIGLGFIVGGATPNEEAILQDRFIYREIPLGNAVSDHRGATIVLSRNVPLVPFEYVVWETTYVDNFNLYLSTRKYIVLDASEGKLIINTEADTSRHLDAWRDTLDFR